MRVRFFKVMIPIGIGALGNATGNAFSGGFLPGTLSMKPGSTVRNRPVASSSFCTLVDKVLTSVAGVYIGLGLHAVVIGHVVVSVPFVILTTAPLLERLSI